MGQVLLQINLKNEKFQMRKTLNKYFNVYLIIKDDVDVGILAEIQTEKALKEN